MAYETGTGSTLEDVRDAFVAFLIAEGWVASGNVLSSPNGCHVLLGYADSSITVTVGTGESGGSLTGAHATPTRLRQLLTGDTPTAPLTYEAHAHGDEAYLFVTWGDATRWLHLGFGRSPVPGLPGSGCWCFGSSAQAATTGLRYPPNRNMGYPAAPDSSNNGTGPFWVTGNQPANSYVHHGLDSNTWTQATGGTIYPPGNGAHAFGCISALLVRGANAFNGEAPLLPVRPYVGRGSNKLSIVAQLESMRYVNIQNLTPQQVIALGTDKWRIYPFYRKGDQLAPGTTHTGWLGLAVRYDGP